MPLPPIVVRALSVLCACAATADPASAQCRRVWKFDLPPIQSNDGFIYDTAVWDDGRGPALFAVGFLAISDGASWTDGVARWNGANWEPVGGGVGYTTHTGYPEVHAIAVFNGELIIAGDFTRAGNVPANNIARWNGTNWAPLGEGFSEIVYALTEYNGKLIAGGRAWDGTSWTSLPPGQPVYTPLAMTVYNGDLIVGGDGLDYLSRFDGTSWSRLGGQVDGVVEALTVYNGELVAGGSFYRVGGGQALPNLARWNGTRWAPLSAPGEIGWVKALTEYDGALIVGGYFQGAGGLPANNVARWNANGSGAWSVMGSGMPGGSPYDNGVFDFSVLDGDLIAAGSFPTPAGSPTILNWARWSCTDVPDAVPVAQLSGPPTGTRYQAVQFSAAGSNDPDGTPVLYYYWTFGDGSSAVGMWPGTSHQYLNGGNYFVTLRVSDGENISPAVSTTVTITVPNTPPAVSLTAPAPNTTLAAPASMTVAASATDSDGTIALVEFFQGSTSLGVDTTAPYSVSWTNVAAGRYMLTARARDNSGAVTTSSAVVVSVDATFGAAADTYVRDGASANSSFGSTATADVRTSTSGNNRWTYLRFNTTGVATVTSARLRLFGALSAASLSAVRTAVYGSANTTWGESTLTWNNKPAVNGGALAAQTLANSTTARWYEWDITSYVKQEKAAGRHVVTLVLQNTTSSLVQGVFRTRENASNTPLVAITP